MCLPVTRRAQFALKLVVTLVLGTALGGVMPWVAEGCWAGGHGQIHEFGNGTGFLPPVMLTCLVAAGTTVISFYASTLMRNLLQAMGAAVVIGFQLVYLSLFRSDPPPWGIALIGYIALPVTLAVLLGLAFKNYSHLHVGWRLWRRNLLTAFTSLFVAVTTAAAVYQRPWELLRTLEPRRGPARLSGSIRPRICSAAGSKLFVLLPDGRVWAAGRYELKETDEYEDIAGPTGEIRERVKVRIPIPVEGTLLGGNWVSLASSDNQVFGIQSDGSLWKVFSLDRTISWWNVTNLSVIPRPQRDETDPDWKTVASGQSHFLALKNDGTLWGWGDNHYGQLGSGSNEFANRPVRIGVDSDWAAIFAAGSVSIGVKRDGSVWKWGALAVGPNNWEGWKQVAHPKLENWNLDGTGWVARAGGPFFDLALRQDGTLSAAGNLPQNLFGIHGDPRFIPKLLRIGRDSDWADVASRFRCLVGIKNDGTLFSCNQDAGPVFWWGNLRKPSKYSDWIAVEADGWYESVALAADGTLCAWGEPTGQSRLLGPTRKPLWSLNIFVTVIEKVRPVGDDTTAPARVVAVPRRP